MVRNELTFFLVSVPALFSGALVLGGVLIQRCFKHFHSAWRRLELLIFFVTVLYLLLFALFASACVCMWCGNILWIKASVSTALIFGTLLFIVYVFCYIFEKGKGRQTPEAIPDRTAAAGLTAVDTENVEERILRQLVLLFEEKKIYREFDLRIEDVAMRIGTNRTYVSNVLNKKCGCHFQHYVNRYRLEEAQKLILETDKPMKQIAEMVGFNSISTFNCQFKIYSKCSPTEWKVMFQKME